MNKEFYTVDEVAEKLGVTKYTVREWIKAGHLNAIKMGKAYRITEDQFQTYLEKNTTNN